jgi:hypothetical protein
VFPINYQSFTYALSHSPLRLATHKTPQVRQVNPEYFLPKLELISGIPHSLQRSLRPGVYPLEDCWPRVLESEFPELELLLLLPYLVEKERLLEL